MLKYQNRNVKQHGNISPLKTNSTTKDLNNNEEEEIANIEFQKPIVKMINELKEETQKVVCELKEDMNKQLNEFKKNSNK
jgi:hypothetical protein